MRTSIRGELIYKLLLGSYLMLAVAGGWLYFHLRSSLSAQFDQELLGTASRLAEDFKFEGTRFEFSTSPEWAWRFQLGDAAEYFEFWLESTPLLRSPSLEDKDLPGVKRARPEGSFFDLRLPDGRMGRAVARALGTGPEGIGPGRQPSDRVDRQTETVVLVYASSREALDARLHSLLLGLSALALLLPTAVTLLVRWVVGRALLPLLRPGSELQGISPDQLERRLTLSSLPGELIPLVARLNELMDRAEQARKRERRFTENLARELRRPVSELLALTDEGLSELRFRNSNLRIAGLQEKPRDRQPEMSLASLLSDSRVIGLRIEKVIDSLLDLSRHEAGERELVPEWIDLPALIAGNFRELEPESVRRGVQARFHMPASASVYVDRTLLSGVVSNLLSNAVRHAPEGSWFECRVEIRNDSVVVRFRNPCHGLAEGDLERLWEPFWRQSRNAGGEDHCGLGLTLVRTYVRALGGAVEADLSEQGTLDIEFRTHNFRVISGAAEEPEEAGLEPGSSSTSAESGTA